MRIAAAFVLLATACTTSVAEQSDPPTDEPEVKVNPALEGWCQVESKDFSFFVTSMNSLWALSGDDIQDMNGGFGGNFGGLAGADAICQDIAQATGHGDKTWRAFLSARDGGDGNPVNAIDRIGAGPWHDANGRLVATSTSGLTAAARPDGDEATINDLPDECGLPISLLGDAHDVVTGSDTSGRLYQDDLNATCDDWTSASTTVGVGGGRNGPLRCGHSFPRRSGDGSGAHMISDHPLRGCSPGANLLQNGAGEGTCIGCSGGYGAMYCFAE